MQPQPLSSSITEVRMHRNPLSASQVNLQNSMIPYDGQGYGKSMNWHYLSIKIAKKNDEKCEHFDKEKEKFNIDDVLIKLAPIQEDLDVKLKFKVTCAVCDKSYPKTSEKLTNKFLKFYGL